MFVMSEIDRLLQIYLPQNVQKFDEWVAVSWDTPWVTGRAFLRLSGSSKHAYQLKFQSKPKCFKQFKTRFIETNDLDVLEFLLKMFVQSSQVEPSETHKQPDLTLDKLPYFFDDVPELRQTTIRLTFENDKHVKFQDLTSTSIVAHFLDVLDRAKDLPTKGIIVSQLVAFFLHDEKGARLLLYPVLAENVVKKYEELSLDPRFFSTTTSDKLITTLKTLYV